MAKMIKLRFTSFNHHPKIKTIHSLPRTHSLTHSPNRYLILNLQLDRSIRLTIAMYRVMKTWVCRSFKTFESTQCVRPTFLGPNFTLQSTFQPIDTWLPGIVVCRFVVWYRLNGKLSGSIDDAVMVLVEYLKLIWVSGDLIKSNVKAGSPHSRHQFILAQHIVRLHC